MRSLLALLLLALLLVGTTKAATHVNISIGHQAATNPADVTYVDGQAPAELRAGPTTNSKHHSDFAYPSNNHEERFGHYRSGDERTNANYKYAQESSARLTASNERARSEAGQRQHQHQRNYQQSSQDKQNQEFERYIQSYHSGPTVETVFESATPSSSQRQTSSSSSTSTSSFQTTGGSGVGGISKSERVVAIGSRPAQVHSFERQVALPTAAPTNALLPPADDRQTHTIVNHQPKLSSNGADVSLSSSSNGYDQNNFEQGGGGGGNGYNKPSFNGYDDNDVQNQYPPVVDESSQGDFNSFGGHEQSHGFYGGGGGSTPAPGYLPSYPRPVVTKTIQIAQPALKAKKYEIRHPAIQKEFYDIEERVLIKPAGTIVVELERPVAKIPKGETILPLGHPHPAVASAYNTNGAAVVQTMGSDVVNNNNGNNNFHNNQYSPSPVYNPKTAIVNEPQHPQTPVISSTTIASTLTTTPTYDDDAAKDEFVESNLNKQFNGDAQFITTTDRSYNDDSNQNGDGGFFVTTTESNRNYNTQFYGRDETDRRFGGNTGHVEVKNNGAPGVSTSFVSNTRPQGGFAVSGQGSFGSGRSQYQPSNSYNDNNQYKGEFLSNEYYNQPQAAKPARLQEKPRQFSNDGPTTHVIKHEHNIHLPASQHNIYLGRLEKEQPQQQTARLTNNGHRYNEEAAHVLELKPYLKHHPGSVVVYASSSKRPAAAAAAGYNNNYNQQRNYEPVRYAQNSGRNYPQVQYSAPYSQMRYHPDQSARYVYGSESSYGRYQPDQSARYAYGSESSNARYQPDQSARYAYGSESSNARYQPDQSARYAYSSESSNARHQPDQPARYVYGSESPYDRAGKLVAQNDNSKNNDDNMGYQSTAKSDSQSHPQAHIQIQIPHHPHEADKPIVVSSTISPVVHNVKEERTARYRQPSSASAVYYDDSSSKSGAYRQRAQPASNAYNYERSANLESVKSDCNDDTEQTRLADYRQLKSLRIVESPNAGAVDSSSSTNGAVNPGTVDVNLKSAAGHIAATPGSRVIAATPAPTDAAASSESFHKRRIVVNHPFQTVREVVEHEPITNYHHVQVNEPASPEFYHHTAPYYQQQTHGAIRQVDALPLVYHHSATTHGNLHYAPAIPFVHGAAVGYHHYHHG